MFVFERILLKNGGLVFSEIFVCDSHVHSKLSPYSSHRYDV